MTCLIDPKPAGKNMKQLSVVFFVSMTMISTTSFADAGDSIESTSIATSNVSLTKRNVSQVTGIEDIVFERTSLLESDAAISMNICVRHTEANYTISVTSSNHAFKTTNGDHTIPYAVTWNGVEVNYDSSFSSSTENWGTGCRGGDASILVVNFEPEYFNGTPLGTYTDILTIALAPE